jgi:hypothetical protein
MDAKTIAGAGMIIGGGLLGFKSMRELSSLGCYGPAGYLTLGLAAIGGGLYLFGRLQGEAVGEATESLREDVAAVLGSETEYAGLPVIPNSFGDNSAPVDGHGVPQWYGSAEEEAGLPVIDNSFGENSAGEYGHGVPQWVGSAEFYGNPRKIMTDRWGNKRYVRRRKDGTIMKNVDMKRSLAVDRRMKAKNYAPAGFRDYGDAKPDGFINRLGRDLQNLMGAETAKEPVIPNSFGDNSAGDSSNGVPVWYGSAEARTRMTTKDGTRRYVRRNKNGQFTSYQVNVDGKKGAIANDRRQHARNYAKPGFRDQGDANPGGQASRQGKNAEFEAPRTILNRGGNRQYIRRNKQGQFTNYQVNIAGKKGAAAIDRRKDAVNYAKAGYRDQGDARPSGSASRNRN